MTQMDDIDWGSNNREEERSKSVSEKRKIRRQKESITRDGLKQNEQREWKKKEEKRAKKEKGRRTL